MLESIPGALNLGTNALTTPPPPAARAPFVTSYNQQGVQGIYFTPGPHWGDSNYRRHH